jgi:hypothetical protein
MIRIALASIVFLVSGVAVGGLAYWWDMLPTTEIAPKTAERDRVFTYLVVKDLAQQDKAARAELIDRLQQELLSQPFDTTAAAELTRAQEAQLIANLRLLEEEWFWLRVSEYQSLPEEKRFEFLLDQVKLVSQWSTLEAGDESEETTPPDPVGAFIGRMKTWVSTVAQSEQEDAWQTVRDGVICWLAADDVGEMNLAMRKSLARNIAANLGFPSMGNAEIELPLTESQETQLAENGKLLMEAWLNEQAELYAAIPDEEKLGFVDALIAELSSWKILGTLFAPESSAQPSNSNPSPSLTFKQIGRIVAETNIWIDRADAQSQQEMRKLLNAVQTRYATKQLGRFFGGE